MGDLFIKRAGSNPHFASFVYSMNYLIGAIFLFMIEMVFSFFDIDCQENTTTLNNILHNNLYDYNSNSN